MNELNRRRALLVLGGGGLAALAAACNGSTTTSSATTTSTTTSATTPTSPASNDPTSEIPDETAGPYPGDGSNGPDVLTQNGVVRQDIRPSFGQYAGTAEGLPLTLKLRVLDLRNGASPLAGAAVYVWHCDRDGNYSLYTVRNQNYLRGVQTTDANGDLSFTSIYPGCYSGRWPHIHFEVYSSLDQATAAGTKLKTSQLALPEDACTTAYATSGYGTSAANLSRTSLQQDMVFSDGWSSELATVTGDATNGFVAELTLAV